MRKVVFGVLFLLCTGNAAAFWDVDSDHLNFEAISFMEERDFVEGYGDGRFGPYETVNRAEFVKMVVEMRGMEIGGEGCFSDVVVEWFAPYICGAAREGLVDGYVDGSFGPGREVNFVEAAKILAGPQVQEGGEWFDSYLAVIEEAGAIPETIYRLDQRLTRGEVAEMMWRLEVGEVGEVKVADVKEGKVSVDLERGLSKEMDLFFGMDYSMVNFEDRLVLGYEEAVVGFAHTFAYDRMMVPILAGEWEVLAAVVGEEMVVLARFEEYSKVRILLSALATRMDAMARGYERGDGVEYWTDEFTDLYFARMGDVFVFTNSEGLRADTLWRLRRGAGFSGELERGRLLNLGSV